MNLIHTTTLEYPRSLWQLRQQHPNVSFPANPTDEDLAPFDHANVHPSAQPERDPAMQEVVEVAPVEVDGQWRQAWEVRNLPPPPPPAPDFQGFYDSLLISPCYSAALTQVMTASSAAPAAALAVLISAIQDALNGRPNPSALQASIGLLLSQISLGAEHLAELQGLLVAAHLDGLLSLEPPPVP